MTFDRLMLWHDPVPRTGPENMAVDEWLLETMSEPVLRIYEWAGDWVSLGYFGRMEDVRSLIPVGEAKLVRRATGGGIVDHRVDRTYSLIVPGREKLAHMVGAKSYRVIHAALAAALTEVGIENRLIEDDEEGDSPACFENPVAWDVVEGAGKKLAGAAQRRTRRGLLHQGSLIVPRDADGVFTKLAQRLASGVERASREPSGEELAASIEKFASRSWLERR